MTFILVPGAGGDSWYWHRVVPLLTAAGHRAVGVDLPASDDAAGLAEYADVIDKAASSHVVISLVAQSLGGFSAPMVAARRPVRELVLVNAMIPASGETGGAWWANTQQGAARSAKAQRDGRVLVDDFDVVAEFLHDVPDDIVAEAFRRGEPQQSDRPFADPWPVESWPDVPTRVVARADDRFFPGSSNAASPPSASASTLTSSPAATASLSANPQR